MRDEYCIYEKDPQRRVATITFNKPEKLNGAVTDDWRELVEKIQDAEADDTVKSIVFKGAGRCFGSGHDVADLGPHHGWGEDARRPSMRRRIRYDNHVFWGRRGIAQTVGNCEKVTIAQVHGYCYGGHHEMALNCDITIAAEDALFTHPGYRYIGPLGNIALFIHTMGVKKAKEMMLTGTPLTAQEALACGLVNRVVPLDKLEEEVAKIVGVVAKQPLDAIVLGKAFFEAALDVTGAGAGHTLGYITHCFQTNIRYESDEYNLFKSRKDKGMRAAFRERDAAYDTQLAR